MFDDCWASFIRRHVDWELLVVKRTTLNNKYLGLNQLFLISNKYLNLNKEKYLDLEKQN